MIDIVVPVYNEGENIKSLFEQIAEKISIDKNIYIVYDFDEDNTVPVVSDLQSKYDFNIKLTKNIYGRGALNAIKTGFAKSSQNAVLVLMADLSDSIEIVPKMYDKILEGYDVVCGSRYMKGGKQIGGPFLKKIISRVAGVSLHYLTGIPTHDITNSFKMYSKKLLNNIEIESNGGFELGMEIVVKAFVSGYRITEIPSYWYDRAAGESNFKMWKWIPHYLHWYAFAIRKTWLRGVG